MHEGVVEEISVIRHMIGHENWTPRRIANVLTSGGPRMTGLLATELGYDAGFGRGTLPSEVAAFVATRVAK